VKPYQRRTESLRRTVGAAVEPVQAEQSVAERLVVVHDVELRAAGGQMAAGAQREGQRFREAAGPHGGDLQGVDPVAVLLAPRRAERVGLPVQVEAGQLGEGDAALPPVGAAERPVVQYGVRLSADDLDGVAEPGQLTGEVADVDALTAAEGIALVAQQGDAQWAVPVGARAVPVSVRSGRDGPGPGCLSGLCWHSRPPSPCGSAGA
jgi:hypothetical protein